MSKQIKMVAQEEKDDDFVSRGYSRENKNGRIFKWYPRRQENTYECGVLRQSKYGTDRNYEISDTQNKFHSL